LIASGKSDSLDFAFIDDADKFSCLDYYKQALTFILGGRLIAAAKRCESIK